VGVSESYFTIAKDESDGPLCSGDDYIEGFMLLVVEGHKYIEPGTGLPELCKPNSNQFLSQLFETLQK
jgi:hypothetical protein